MRRGASSITVASPRRIRTRWVTRSISRRVSIGAPDPLTSAMPSSQWCSAARSSRFNHAACERYHSASARSAASAVCSTPAAMASAAAGWLTAMSAAAASRRRRTPAASPRASTAIASSRAASAGVADAAARSARSAAAERSPAARRCLAASTSSHTSARRAWIARLVVSSTRSTTASPSRACARTTPSGCSRTRAVPASSTSPAPAAASRSRGSGRPCSATTASCSTVTEGSAVTRARTAWTNVGDTASPLTSCSRSNGLPPASSTSFDLDSGSRVGWSLSASASEADGVSGGTTMTVTRGVALDRQWAPARHDEWNVTGEQVEHLQRAVVAPVGVLDDQGVVAELGGDVGGDVGGRALQRAAEGVRQAGGRGARGAARAIGRRRGCASAGRVGRGSTCRSPPARGRARFHLRRAATMTRPGAPPKRATPSTVAGHGTRSSHQAYRGWQDLGRRLTACGAYRQPPMGRCGRTPI